MSVIENRTAQGGHRASSTLRGSRSRIAAVMAVLLLLGAGPATAQLMVHPTRVVLEEGQRSATLEIINNSDEAGTYRISVVNRRMDEHGGFSAVEAPQAGERFADHMLRYSPRRVTLAPGAGQVIRVMARRPADRAPGEYRSHLMFAKQPDLAARSSSEAADEGDDGAIGIALTALIGVSIPVIVRDGETSAEVTIDGLALEEESGGAPQAAMTLHRSGNQSVYGDLTVSFAPAGGGAHVIGKAGGVAVYVPNVLRHVKLRLDLPAGIALEGGTLSVTYAERAEHGGAMLAQASAAVP